jgi:hypothetical protein
MAVSITASATEHSVIVIGPHAPFSLAEVLCGWYHGEAWRSLISGDLSLYSMIIITCVVMDEIFQNGRSIL